MKAKRSNRSHMIEPREKDKFLAQGYDVYDDNGELIAYGVGKMISANKYLEVLNENKELKEKIKLLESKEKKTNKEEK